MLIQGLTDASQQNLEKIAQSAEIEGGFFQDLGQGVKELALGRPDYGTWTNTLAQKLENIGDSIWEIDKRDLIDWYDRNYTVDQAVQLALQT